jgi:hypothetical protein
MISIQRCKTHVRVFLKKLGMGYRKVGSVPAGPDPDEQEQFKKSPHAENRAGQRGKRYLLLKYEIRRWGTITTSGYFCAKSERLEGILLMEVKAMGRGAFIDV